MNRKLIFSLSSLAALTLVSCSQSLPSVGTSVASSSSAEVVKPQQQSNWNDQKANADSSAASTSQTGSSTSTTSSSSSSAVTDGTASKVNVGGFILNDGYLPKLALSSEQYDESAPIFSGVEYVNGTAPERTWISGDLPLVVGSDDSTVWKNINTLAKILRITPVSDKAAMEKYIGVELGYDVNSASFVSDIESLLKGETALASKSDARPLVSYRKNDSGEYVYDANQAWSSMLPNKKDLKDANGYYTWAAVSVFDNDQFHDSRYSYTDYRRYATALIKVYKNYYSLKAIDFQNIYFDGGINYRGAGEDANYGVTGNPNNYFVLGTTDKGVDIPFSTGYFTIGLNDKGAFPLNASGYDFWGEDGETTDWDLGDGLEGTASTDKNGEKTYVNVTTAGTKFTGKSTISATVDVQGTNPITGDDIDHEVSGSADYQVVSAVIVPDTLKSLTPDANPAAPNWYVNGVKDEKNGGYLTADLEDGAIFYGRGEYVASGKLGEDESKKNSIGFDSNIDFIQVNVRKIDTYKTPVELTVGMGDHYLGDDRDVAAHNDEKEEDIGASKTYVVPAGESASYYTFTVTPEDLGLDPNTQDVNFFNIVRTNAGSASGLQIQSIFVNLKD